MSSMIVPGEIWLTCPDVWLPALGRRVHVGESDLVLVVEGTAGSRYVDEPDLRVVPLSRMVAMGAEHDVVLSAAETGLEFAVLAETWNARPVLARNLLSKASEITLPALQRVVRVHDTKYTGELSPDSGGAPIEDESDQRIGFQRTEHERFEYLSVPVHGLLAERERAAGVEAPPSAVECYFPWDEDFFSKILLSFSARLSPVGDVPRRIELSAFVGGGQWESSIDYGSPGFQLGNVSLVRERAQRAYCGNVHVVLLGEEPPLRITEALFRPGRRLTPMGLEAVAAYR